MDDVRGVGKTLQVETNIQGVPPKKKNIGTIFFVRLNFIKY